MCWSAKSCITAWWIAVIVALMLWYRNYSYDRVIAVTVLVLGLIQLINYGSHSAVDPAISGKCIVLLLITLVLVVAFSTYLYTHSTASKWLSIIAIIISAVMVAMVFWSKVSYLSFVDNMGDCPRWTNGSSNILGGWIWVVITILVAAWVIILVHHDCNDLGLYLVAGYVLLTLIWSAESSNSSDFGSKWTYLLVGLGLVVWLAGMVSEFFDHRPNGR